MVCLCGSGAFPGRAALPGSWWRAARQSAWRPPACLRAAAARARQELLAAGDLLFIGKLGLRKTRLVDHAFEFRKPSTARPQENPESQKLNQRLPKSGAASWRSSCSMKQGVVTPISLSGIGGTCRLDNQRYAAQPAGVGVHSRPFVVSHPTTRSANALAKAGPVTSWISPLQSPPSSWQRLRLPTQPGIAGAWASSGQSPPTASTLPLATA